MTNSSGDSLALGVELRLSVVAARFGGCDVRVGAPGRSFEVASLAGGCGVAGVVAGIVVGELTLSLLGDHPKDAEV